METMPLITALVALVSTMLLGVIRSFFDSMKTWHPLAVQASVVVISTLIVGALHFFDFGLIPEMYRGALFGILQGIVAGLTAVGMNNVKDGAKYGTAGVRRPDSYTTTHTIDHDKQ